MNTTRENTETPRIVIAALSTIAGLFVLASMTLSASALLYFLDGSWLALAAVAVLEGAYLFAMAFAHFGNLPLRAKLVVGSIVPVPLVVFLVYVDVERYGAVGGLLAVVPILAELALVGVALLRRVPEDPTAPREDQVDELHAVVRDTAHQVAMTEAAKAARDAARAEYRSKREADHDDDMTKLRSTYELQMERDRLAADAYRQRLHLRDELHLATPLDVQSFTAPGNGAEGATAKGLPPVAPPSPAATAAPSPVASATESAASDIDSVADEAMGMLMAATPPPAPSVALDPAVAPASAVAPAAKSPTGSVDDDGNPLMSTSEVAAFLGKKPATVRSWKARGKLSPVDSEARVSLYRRSDVEAL